MKIEGKKREIILGLKDGRQLQKLWAEGDHRGWSDVHADISSQLFDVVNWADDRYPDLYRLKPEGQHAYHLVTKNSAGKRELSRGNPTYDDVQFDLKYLSSDQEPLYVVHIEFDPEDDTIRLCNRMELPVLEIGK